MEEFIRRVMPPERGCEASLSLWVRGVGAEDLLTSEAYADGLVMEVELFATQCTFDDPRLSGRVQRG